MFLDWILAYYSCCLPPESLWFPSNFYLSDEVGFFSESFGAFCFYGRPLYQGKLSEPLLRIQRRGQWPDSEGQPRFMTFSSFWNAYKSFWKLDKSFVSFATQGCPSERPESQFFEVQTLRERVPLSPSFQGRLGASRQVGTLLPVAKLSPHK